MCDVLYDAHRHHQHIRLMCDLSAASNHKKTYIRYSSKWLWKKTNVSANKTKILRRWESMDTVHCYY